MSRTDEFEELRPLRFMLPPSWTRVSADDSAAEPMVQPVIQPAFSSSCGSIAATTR